MYTLVRAKATIDHDQDTTYRQCHKYRETGAHSTVMHRWEGFGRRWRSWCHMNEMVRWRRVMVDKKYRIEWKNGIGVGVKVESEADGVL